jgi:hypothetical protein
MKPSLHIRFNSTQRSVQPVFELAGYVDNGRPSYRIADARGFRDGCKNRMVAGKACVAFFRKLGPVLFQRVANFARPSQLIGKPIDHLFCRLHAMVVRPKILSGYGGGLNDRGRRRTARPAGNAANDAKADSQPKNACDYSKSFLRRHPQLPCSAKLPNHYHARCRTDLFVSANLLLFPATVG